ncbi:MAG TPA: hypothetical protein VG826_05990 [Pirellulales bacterium]|nr:hypothetical protein [Pirellulales bacterium]
MAAQQAGAAGAQLTQSTAQDNAQASEEQAQADATTAEDDAQAEAEETQTDSEAEAADAEALAQAETTEAVFTDLPDTLIAPAEGPAATLAPDYQGGYEANDYYVHLTAGRVHPRVVAVGSRLGGVCDRGSDLWGLRQQRSAWHAGRQLGVGRSRRSLRGLDSFPPAGPGSQPTAPGAQLPIGDALQRWQRPTPGTHRHPQQHRPGRLQPISPAHHASLDAVGEPRAGEESVCFSGGCAGADRGGCEGGGSGESKRYKHEQRRSEWIHSVGQRVVSP